MHPSFTAFNIVCCISLSKIKKMNFAQGRNAKNAFKIKELNSYRMGIMGLNQGTLLVIKIPDSRVLRIISRSLFFALFLLTLPSIGSDLRGCFYNNAKSDGSFDPAVLNLVKMLFPDFVDEGLVKRGHKGLVVGSSVDNMLKEIDLLSENGIDLIVESNSDENKLIPNESLDFVIGLNFKNTKPVDRVLKTGGIVITQLNNEPLGLVQRLPNYRIVFLRRFQNTVVAMRKVGLKDQSLIDDDPSNDLIPPCGISQEARKMALTGLEDALLEPPPRRALKSKDGSRKMKFLPNLLGDSLSSYPRRIFVSDEKNGVDDWFHNNYPARNQYFEVYNLEPMATNGVVSEWLRNNVRQEDFVVMKAEAQIVEEMMKDKAMCLVDELFLECKNQWQEEESKRAYWQCLTLYGSLRDQGVAVHQWWS